MNEGIIRPSSANVGDAILQADEHEGLLRAINGEGIHLSPASLKQAMVAFKKVLVANFPNSNAAKEIAIIATVLANMMADDLMGIERVSPITDAGRDGRVAAVKTFFNDLLTRAVQMRAEIKATGFKPN